jgi:hypothetical protein
VKRIGRLNFWNCGPTKAEPPWWPISWVRMGPVLVGCGVRWHGRFYALDWLGGGR